MSSDARTGQIIGDRGLVEMSAADADIEVPFATVAGATGRLPILSAS
jgi:hypothetical protein